MYSSVSTRNAAAYENLKEFSQSFLTTFTSTLSNLDKDLQESCTLVTYSMKSDHPLVLLRQQYLLYCKNLINWDVFLAQALDNVSNLPRSPHIDSPLKSNSHTELQPSALNPQLLPSLSSPSKLLNDVMVSQIVQKLPNYLKFRDWDLIFSTDTHGWSLNTFYRNCENYGSNILVIKDENHYVFGAFANQSWVHCRNFYGNGECFLFTFENSQEMKYFYASLENEFYMSSDSQCIIMGGGNDCGLFINQDLTKGHSGFSETFMNKTLSSSADFTVICIELWGPV